MGLSLNQRFVKRTFDLVFSSIGLLSTWWLIIIVYLVARFSTKEPGFYKQKRVGKNGEYFDVIKIRTMRSSNTITTTVTSSTDKRITRMGAFFRKTKLDELPQLINVLKGEMSFVGPRPDVPGFADCLTSEDRIILSIRPGITGPATLFYRNEEELLAEQEDPERYNREVIFPRKIAINKEYIREFSIINDLKYIKQTVFR